MFRQPQGSRELHSSHATAKPQPVTCQAGDVARLPPRPRRDPAVAGSAEVLIFHRALHVRLCRAEDVPDAKMKEHKDEGTQENSDGPSLTSRWLHRKRHNFMRWPEVWPRTTRESHIFCSSYFRLPKKSSDETGQRLYWRIRAHEKLSLRRGESIAKLMRRPEQQGLQRRRWQLQSQAGRRGVEVRCCRPRQKPAAHWVSVWAERFIPQARLETFLRAARSRPRTHNALATRTVPTKRSSANSTVDITHISSLLPTNTSHHKQQEQAGGGPPWGEASHLLMGGVRDAPPVGSGVRG